MNKISTQNNCISIGGARVHNLKNITLQIPRDKLVVVTGLSGSGKSSLAFDTLYAEGQRRYVESLSAYARQFLGRVNKPEVDYIRGIPPAVAIEQKVNSRNPRSTVGTSTEVYDYLKLLFARVGETRSPVSGQLVQKDTVTTAVDALSALPLDTPVMIMAPLHDKSGRDCHEHLGYLQSQGYSRVEYNKEVKRIDEALELGFSCDDEVNILIDRIKVSLDEDSLGRYADSVQTAFNESHGECILVYEGNDGSPKRVLFNNRFERDGIEFEEPSVHMFSFNNPLGACPVCEGYGKVIGIDEELVVPNKNLSVYEDAIVCWKGETLSAWKEKLVYAASKFDFPVHKPYYQLTPEQRMLLWSGNRYFKGIREFFNQLEEKKYKIQNRVMLARYSGKTTCHECNGSRLKKGAHYVFVGGRSLPELVLWPIADLYPFFRDIQLHEHQYAIAGRVLKEITTRLEYLMNVGLGYLTLNRLSSTLSGGESQRINLATSLGSSLVGSLYILDEPSIGLHPKDTALLIKVLRKLQKIGNTVLVVEHDEEIIRAADDIIDIGPLAGRLGGEVIFQGTREQLLNDAAGLTAAYINGRESIPVPVARRKWTDYIEVVGARANNLKGINVKFPLNVFCAVTGVSGSGKSTLVRDILFASLNRSINGAGEKTGAHDLVRGDLSRISAIEFVDQNPIGKSSRSNPVTYIKAYDEIRKLMSEQQAAKISGFKPSHFSFNVEGGRCEECLGEGEIKVEMQFMADIHLLCESCHGRRFKDDVLDVLFKNKSIHDILELSVDEAIEFFSEHKESKKIAMKLQPLADVGLGYVKLGQSSSTLSGGESQRVKLASFLSKDTRNEHPTLFIFDEPTTGLHFHDIKVLMKAFNALIENRNSIIVIEHNMDVVKSADWVIDLGPGGGEEGGGLVYEGTPEGMIACPGSYTGNYLSAKL